MMSASLCLLTACFEVEDNSSSDVAAAIQAQNEILSGTTYPTNETLTSTVALTGIIVNALDGKEVSKANVTIIAADEIIQDSLVFTGGEFKIENLPSNSDIEVVIESTNEEFLSRVFFINTGNSDAINTSNDFGTFEVSIANTMQVSVINKTTGLPLSALEFIAYSHAGSSSRASKYKHTSTYDEVNGIYNITVPKFINTAIRANLDINKDGEIDFTPESNNNLSGNDLYVSSSNTQDILTLYVEENMPLAEVEFRITLIDSSANALLGAELTATGSDEVESQSVFDEESEQYVLSATFGNSSTIEIPAFSVNDIDYQSSSILFNMNSEGSLTVHVSGTLGNSYYKTPYLDIIELAIMPRPTDSGTSNLEVVTAAKKVNVADHSFSVFYSQQITASASNLSLTNTSGYTVVKGNDDSNDIVLPGTTIISGNVDVPVSFETSLNNTKLTITPISTLTSGQSYQYDINSLVVTSTEQSVDVNGDSLSFSIEDLSDDAFDINEVRVDNNNFTTNGVAITVTNTAGDVANPSNNNSNIYIYLPSSIETLQNFSLRLVSITVDDISNNSIRDYRFVRDGSPYNVSTLGLIQLAENETILSDNLSINIEKGSAQEDSQKVYSAYTYYYMSDDMNNSENSLTFEYAYETKAGVVSTGTIKIPVQ